VLSQSTADTCPSSWCLWLQIFDDVTVTMYPLTFLSWLGLRRWWGPTLAFVPDCVFAILWNTLLEIKVHRLACFGETPLWNMSLETKVRQLVCFSESLIARWDFIRETLVDPRSISPIVAPRMPDSTPMRQTCDMYYWGFPKVLPPHIGVGASRFLFGQYIRWFG
jgi:hypothetical protein